jgi:hypothetical protein
MHDNMILKATGDTLERLKYVSNLSGSNTVVGYAIEGNTFVLFKYSSDKMTPLPCPVQTEQIMDLVFTWVKSTADYGSHPGIDGHCTKGWLCYCDSWSQVDGFGHESFLAIKPYWCMYGK